MATNWDEYNKHAQRGISDEARRQVDKHIFPTLTAKRHLNPQQFTKKDYKLVS